MANYREDYSRYKKNELGTYLLKSELSKYLANQEKKKTKESNPFVSSIYSSITSSVIALVIYFKIDLGQYLKQLNDDSLRNILTLAFSILFAIVFGLIYYLLYNFYFYVLNHKMNKISSWFKSQRIINESNLDKLVNKEDLTETSYIEKFNHQVSDRVAMVLNIVDRLDESKPLEEEDVFFLDEAFQSLKRAMDILELEIITSEFYYEKILSPNFTKLKKYRINHLVALADKLVKKFDILAEEGNIDFKNDVAELTSTVYRIKRTLNKETKDPNK